MKAAPPVFGSLPHRLWDTPLFLPRTLLLLLLLAPSSADVHVVHTCDEASLKAAIAQGGEVLINCDGIIPLTSEILVRKDLTLTADGAVTISGQNQTRLFNLSNVTAEFRNITFANGHHRGANGVLNFGIHQEPEDALGGALVITNSKVAFTSCAFEQNHARGGDGDGFSPASFPSFTRTGNAYGGAIFATNSTLYFSGCRAASNSISPGAPGTAYSLFGPARGFGGFANGGAVFISGGSIEITGSIFEGNMVQGEYSRISKGGAISLLDSFCRLRGALFSENTSTGPNAVIGGALESNSGLLLDQILFRSNRVESSYGSAEGGAVFANGETHITRSVFLFNHAEAGRGVLVNLETSPAHPASGGALVLQSIFTIGNSTFAQNSALGGSALPAVVGFAGNGEGGAIHAGGPSGSIHFSTFTGNAATAGTGPGAESLGGALYVTNGLLELQGIIFSGNAPSNLFGNITDLGGNLSSDNSAPFSHPTSANNIDPRLGDFTEIPPSFAFFPLLPVSPAINRVTENFPETDLLGFPRPLFPPADSGAIEFQGTETRLHISSTPDRLTLQLIAPDYLPYTLEQSSDLLTWEPISPLTYQPFTPPFDPPAQFFRAVANE